VNDKRLFVQRVGVRRAILVAGLSGSNCRIVAAVDRVVESCVSYWWWRHRSGDVETEWTSVGQVAVDL